MDFESLYRSLDVSHLSVEEVEHEMLIRNILYDFKTHESTKRRRLKDRMKEERELGIPPSALARTWRSTPDEIKIAGTAIKLIHKMLKTKLDKEAKSRLRTRMIHYKVRIEHLAKSPDAHDYMNKINEMQFEIAEIFEKYLITSTEKKMQSEAEKKAIKDRITEVLKSVQNELDVLNETASAIVVESENEQEDNTGSKSKGEELTKTKDMFTKLSEYEEGKVENVDALLKLFKEFVLDTAINEKQRRKAEIEREKARKQEIASNIEQKEKLEEILLQVTFELQQMEEQKLKNQESKSGESGNKPKKEEISKDLSSDSSVEEEEDNQKPKSQKKIKKRKKKVSFSRFSSTDASSSSSSSSSSDTSSSSSSSKSSSDSEEDKKSKKKKHKKNKKKHHVKRIPVADWKLKYDGKDGGKKLAEFLKEVKLRCKSENISEKELFRSAIHLFSGRAKDWFIDGTECKDFRNGKDLKKELKREFRPHDLDFQLEVQATNRKQARGEKFSDYFYDMQKIFQNMSEQISERKKFDLIWRNMRHDYKNALTGAGISSLRRLRKYGRIIDENNVNMYQKPTEFVNKQRSSQINEVVTSGKPKSKNRNENSEKQGKSFSNGKTNFNKPKFNDRRNEEQEGKENDQKEGEKQNAMEGTTKETFNQLVTQYKRPPIGVCYNCRLSGHHYAECPKPKNKFCRLCGFADVFTGNCPACLKNAESSA